MRQCAFLTMDSLEGFMAYDHLLYGPMEKRGWEVTEVSWRDPDPQWQRFEAVVIRTPWDYQEDPDRFLKVLEQIDASPARLENPLELVRWNIDKRYLVEVEERGVPVVPTLWPGTGEPFDPDGWFRRLQTDEIIVKPAVSANADHTYRLFHPTDRETVQDLKRVFRDRPFLVQRFMSPITEEGEFSLFWFGETYSHTILKKPRAGDFRVQEEHGGRLQRVEPEPALMKVAGQAVSLLDPPPLYTRLDFVRFGDTFALMELELIEPSLYFTMDPGSAGRFARVFDERMGREEPAG